MGSELSQGSTDKGWAFSGSHHLQIGHFQNSLPIGVLTFTELYPLVGGAFQGSPQRCGLLLAPGGFLMGPSTGAGHSHGSTQGWGLLGTQGLAVSLAPGLVSGTPQTPQQFP